MNLFRKVKSVLLVGLAAAMLSTPAYSTEFSESQIQEEGGAGSFGSYRKDCATGEVQYIPPASETYSIRELERLSAQYDPFADKFETERFSGSELYSTSADSGTLAMTLLTGCGEPSHSYYSLEDSEYDTADFLELEMECSEYERDVKEITYSLANSSDKTFWFGYSFDLHRFDDDSGEWKGVAFEKQHFFLRGGNWCKFFKTLHRNYRP